ncbi:MAG: MATE family efflux transporter [Cohaesibacteraceae bacterium]|nr:MATE family efflux transporter [Cohaesibacteraceae bacterium]MBL4875018.1 MATE family efflux transporter [Cohaesibacteraceae bacterium]
MTIQGYTLQQQNGYSRASMARLAASLSLSGLFAASAILIDSNMVAPLGKDALAAMGLSAGLFGAFMAALFGLGTGAQILLAEAAGRGKRQIFAQRLWFMFALGLSLALILSLLLKLLLPFLIQWLAPTRTIAILTNDYLGLLVYSLPIVFCCYLLSICFDAQRKPARELMGFAFELPANIALNALLIYGLHGFPELGLKGAAIATLVAQSGRLAWLMTLVLLDERVTARGYYVASRAEYRNMGKLLWPVSLNVAILILGAQFYQLIFSQLPVTAFAAIALVAPWLTLANVIGRGVAQSATISCASLLDNPTALARTFAPVEHITKVTSIALAVALLVILSIVYGLSSHIPREVRPTFLWLVPLSAILVYVRTGAVSLGNVLRAVDKPGWVFKIQIGLQWGFALPIVFAGVVIFDLAPFWAVSVLVLEETIRLAFLRHRFRKLGQNSKN